MRIGLLQQVAEYSAKHRRKNSWKKAVTAMASVVVFCTTYALILPAITMERQPLCGMTAHQHSEACYQAAETIQMECALKIHQHGSACYDSAGNLTCGLADFVIHQHDDICYDEEGKPICDLAEVSSHAHTEQCYRTEETVPAVQEHLSEQNTHVHAGECYEKVKGELVCQIVPTQGHRHSTEDGCYDETGTLVCTVEEQEPVVHEHADGCYSWEEKLICDLPEAEETAAQAEVAQAEVAQVVETTSRQILVCQKEELVPHQHVSACYAGDGTLVCGKLQVQKHTHSEECIHRASEKTLVCRLEESEAHQHTDACYGEPPLICGQEEHTHHDAYCYIDTTADVETAADWEAAIPRDLSGNWAKDLVAVAESQLGYAESTKNYKVLDDGETTRGYTRYGAWYGSPYGEWCAMFVSFCLDYAQVPEEIVPHEAYCPTWIEILKEERYALYRDAGEYAPKPGDIIFYDYEGNGLANHVGIVAETTKDQKQEVVSLKAIEGNSGDKVRYVTYDITDTSILGYAELPNREEQESKLSFCDENMEVTLTFPVDYELPEGAELFVSRVDAENNKIAYQAMADSVSESIGDENRIVTSLDIFQMQIFVDDQLYEVPEDIAISVQIEYEEARYTPEEMEMMSELSVVVFEPQGDVANMPLQKPQANALAVIDDVQEDTAQQSDITYTTTERESTFEDVESGVRGVTFDTEGLQTFGLARITETRTGDFWKRVDNISQLNNGDTILIVTAEANSALTYNADGNAVLVDLQQITGNPKYYDITVDSNGAALSPNSKFVVRNKGTNTLQLQNIGSSNDYVAPSNDTLFSSSARALTLELIDSVVTNESEPIHVYHWRMKDGSYYVGYNGSGKMASTNTTIYSRRDLMIFRLVNETLEIPQNPTSEILPPEIPDNPPEYAYPELIGALKGATTVENLPGFTVGYASDPATFDLENRFTGVESDDGKLLTDKTVVYGKDQFGAFSEYAADTFSVTLSALGQVPVVQGDETPVMDVVIILDVSHSMVQNKDGDRTRAEWAVDSLNDVIDQIMEVDSNRVGVVAFSDAAQTILPLDHYTSSTDKYLYLEKDETNYSDHNRVTLFELKINSNMTNSAGKTLTFDLDYGDDGNGRPMWEGTFTQSGIQEAADLLLKEENVVDSYKAPRQPVIVLISDGGPTLVSSNYKEPITGPIYGNSGNVFNNDYDSDYTSSTAGNVNRYGINGYYTVLTAQYYKDLVGSHYNTKAKFASIGIGISGASSSAAFDNAYAQAVLNPTQAYLDAALASSNQNIEATQFVELLKNTYSNAYVNVPNHYNGFNTYITTHSAVPVIKNPYSDFAYADRYYSGTAENLTDSLMEYLNSIQYVIHHWDYVLENETDVTITDPVGVGMEVKEDPKLIFGVGTYVHTNKVTENGVTTYTYNYQIPYVEAYPPNAGADNLGERSDPNSKLNSVLDLSRIRVTVETTGTGLEARQTLTMYVPEDLLPVFFPEKYGEFYYEEYPVRLVYQVGLTQAAIDDANSMSAGEERVYYTNQWQETTTTASFVHHENNEFKFVDLDAVEKTENATETISTSFGKPTEQESPVTQSLGNNGKLVLTKEAAEVNVEKKWEGTPTQSITVRLWGDGVQIDSATLSAENGWKYSWEALPKYNTDGSEIEYTVTEDYVPGYSTVITGNGATITTVTEGWVEKSAFENGKTYLLKTDSGCLSTVSATDAGLLWVTQEAAESSNLAKWTASVSGSKVTLTNGAGQILTFNYQVFGSEYFYATTSEENYQNLTFSGGKLYYDGRLGTYYFGALNGDKSGSSVGPGSALIFSIWTWEMRQADEEIPEGTFIITNTESETQPLDVTIKKISSGNGTELAGAEFDLYRADDNGMLTIPGTEVKGTLVVNGMVSGEDGTCSVQIPGEDGIYYLVETKAPDGFDLLLEPVQITVTKGTPSTITVVGAEGIASADGTTVTVKNVAGYELPETGGIGTHLYTIGGLLLTVAASLLLYNKIRRKEDYISI